MIHTKNQFITFSRRLILELILFVLYDMIKNIKLEIFVGDFVFILNMVAPCQSNFTIKTDCCELANSLKLKHGKYIKSENNKDFLITVIKKENRYEISFGDEILITDSPLRRVEDIMYENRRYDENIFAIHGGAVEYMGGAYLIVAATTSGKTTLTSYLTSKGFGYITDDCILLNRSNFDIYPFNTPMHLRGGGYKVLERLGCLPDNLVLLDDVSIKRYVYTPENCIAQPLPLKKIFFITRTEDLNLLEKMSTNEKITALLKSPIKEYKIDAKYLSFISKLASMPCERIYYSDMNFVAEVIENE